MRLMAESARPPLLTIDMHKVKIHLPITEPGVRGCFFLEQDRIMARGAHGVVLGIKLGVLLVGIARSEQRMLGGEMGIMAAHTFPSRSGLMNHGRFFDQLLHVGKHLARG